ncbi:MAG: ABC transporter ATP-binding protein [Spongiibacteraceae bacterium]
MTDHASQIIIRNLSHSYPGAAAPALQDINLTLSKGRILGLLGPNGAGKSTLLGLLTGQLRVQQGSIDMAGFSARSQMREIKAISALVPQDYAFYPTLTLRNNLEFFAGVYRLGDRFPERLAQCVEICRLDALLDRRAEECSGGEKRRLNLAIALLNAPAILYLDEPTVGIDAESRQHILTAIGQLRRKGTTIIYTSHYLEEVEAICDDVAFINHGKILAHDSLVNLLQQDQGKVAWLRFRSAPAASDLAALSAFAPTMQDSNTLRLNMPSDADPLLLLAQTLAQHQLQPDHVQIGFNRLERIYFDLLAAKPGA